MLFKAFCYSPTEGLFSGARRPHLLRWLRFRLNRRTLKCASSSQASAIILYQKLIFGMKASMKKIIFISFVFLLAGCQMLPTKYSEHSEGQWGSKVLVKDKKKSKSFIVNVDIQARKNKQLRMDVTAALGTPVASLVLNDKEVKYILFRQKRFYSGTTNNRVLSPILSVPLNPQLFFNLLFDEPMADKNWSCAKDNKGFLVACENSQQDLKVTWKDRKGRRKAIHIEHSKADIQMNIKSFSPQAEEVFHLKAPKSFKKYKVR